MRQTVVCYYHDSHGDDAEERGWYLQVHDSVGVDNECGPYETREECLEAVRETRRALALGRVARAAWTVWGPVVKPVRHWLWLRSLRRGVRA